ncbi:MAG: hypothetical protein HUJ68_05285 [Clostridia bacterium]|nr:hypothetical protein [Clostridia bacterium]
MKTKKYFPLFIFITVVLSSCNAHDIIGKGNPAIGKLIAISKIEIITNKEEENIIPKIKIHLQKKQKKEILCIEGDVNFVFGQDLRLIETKKISLDTHSFFIEELNKNGQAFFIVEYSKIKKEDKEKPNSEGILNEERYSVVFNHLQYK